jgi:Fe2+ or Zn2+ uptake regulation protein
MEILQVKVLKILVAEERGLKAPEIMRALRVRVSQPTLWRTLDALRACGAIFVEGRARATRYHAHARTDIAALRSRLMHESVAKLRVR